MIFLKPLFIILGSISLALGIIGIFVPGLPTTPFLLLSAGLFVKSSERLYSALIKNRYLGAQILDFQQKKGLTKKTKIYAICLMLIMISISTAFFVNILAIKIIIVLIGIIGIIVMGFIIKTIK